MGCPKLTYQSEFLSVWKKDGQEKTDHDNFLTLGEKKDRPEKNDNYYPFGLTFNSYSRENTAPQDFKYNGKEEQNELGLGWLDYGARMYDPALGRFFVQDALADFGSDWTPYRYAFDNPIRNIDPHGNYELSVTLSKEENDELKKAHTKDGKLDRKAFNAAKNDRINQIKDAIKSEISALESFLSDENNAEALQVFEDFSGVKKGSEQWKVMFEEGKSGLYINYDSKLSEGKAFTDARPDGTSQVSIGGAKSAFNVGAMFHEYVHVGENWKPGAIIDGSTTGHPNYQRYPLEQQLGAIQTKWNEFVTSGNLNAQRSYSDLIDKGKAVRVEAGYAAERFAFGAVLTAGMSAQLFSNYLKK